MAQITIPDELFQYVQQYAQETGKTQEEIVQEALADLIILGKSELPKGNRILPSYDSAEERQLLASVRTRVGNALATCQRPHA